MSEHQNEQGTQGINLGVSSRTDVGGNVGTQPDANPSSAVQPQTVEVQQQEPTPPQSVQTQQEGQAIEPGKPLGATATPLNELQNQLCPNCHTGVLYVTRYDPYALHERAQGTAFDPARASGGAYDVNCAYCDFSESRAFNPANVSRG